MRVMYIVGHRFTSLPRDRIALGEEGRGRARVIIPIIDGVDPGRAMGTRLDWADAPRASVEVTPAGIRLVPEVREDDRVLAILIGDPGYYRGAVYRYSLPEGARVLAEGRGAYGDAGRLGSWQELLVLLPSSGELKIPGRYRTAWLRWGPNGARILSSAEKAAEDAATAGATEVI